MSFERKCVVCRLVVCHTFWKYLQNVWQFSIAIFFTQLTSNEKEVKNNFFSKMFTYTHTILIYYTKQFFLSFGSKCNQWHQNSYQKFGCKCKLLILLLFFSFVKMLEVLCTLFTVQCNTWSWFAKKKGWHQQNVDVINVSALIRSNVF